MTTCIALLRGINVGGHNRIPMAELRSVCDDIGWENVRTYIQSGNVVFDVPGSAPASGPAVAGTDALASELEAAIERAFGLSIPVIARTATDWAGYVAGNPFPEQSAAEARLVMLGLSRAPPAAGAEAELRARAAGGERVTRVGDALWFYFDQGVARSKLAPALMDRVVGSPVTLRNWRTVLKLQELAS